MAGFRALPTKWSSIGKSDGILINWHFSVCDELFSAM